jgi:hypothetical protein
MGEVLPTGWSDEANVDPVEAAGLYRHRRRDRHTRSGLSSMGEGRCAAIAEVAVPANAPWARPSFNLLDLFLDGVKGEHVRPG